MKVDMDFVDSVDERGREDLIDVRGVCGDNSGFMTEGGSIAKDLARAGYALITSRLPAVVRREAYARLNRGLCWGEVVELIKINFPSVVERFCRANLQAACNQLLRWSDEDGVTFAVFGDVDYPYLLSQCPDPPLILFSRGGDLQDIEAQTMIAIVGSRNCDFRGLEFTSELACELANRGVCIVSGLATGIDTAAHQGALRSDNPNKTIAVLGNGVNHTYPKANHRLTQQIIEQRGVILSQFEPDVRPYPSQFLERNHVIAGMVHGVVVVQAANRSGSLVTARAALDLGRELFAVPGFPGDSRNSGTNKLLQDGAHLVIEAEDVTDILESMGCLITPCLDYKPSKSTEALSPAARELFTKLQEVGNVNLHDLASEYEHSTLSQLILELEMGALIKQEMGGGIRVLTG